jgi:alkylation response protein AidB-like acyl-CoA dehydrogenase
VHTAGAYADSAFSAICGEALQLHGGIGFTWEHDVHLFLRRAKAAQTLYGDPPWHRERLCALLERQVDEPAWTSRWTSRDTDLERSVT